MVAAGYHPHDQRHAEQSRQNKIIKFQATRGQEATFRVHFEAGKILVRETKSGEPRHVPLSRRARWVLGKMAARNPLAAFVFESTARDDSNAPALASRISTSTICGTPSRRTLP